MKRISCLSLGVFALSGLFLADRPALAREMAGVTLPDTLSAGDKTLKLNGLGLRKKAIFKVYVGGLYLEAPSKDAAGIVAADAPKAVRMHFLRDLKKTQLTEAFSEGFEANAKEKAAAQKPALDKMLALVPDVKEGATLSFVTCPGKARPSSPARRSSGRSRARTSPTSSSCSGSGRSRRPRI